MCLHSYLPSLHTGVWGGDEVVGVDPLEAQPRWEQGWWFFWVRDTPSPEDPLYCQPVSCLNHSQMRAPNPWGQEEKGTTEDEVAGWHHWLDGRESEWTPGVGDGQGGLACCHSWGCKESDTTEWLNWTELNPSYETWRWGPVKNVWHGGWSLTEWPLVHPCSGASPLGWNPHVGEAWCHVLGAWTFSSSSLQPHCIPAMVTVHPKSPFCLHRVRHPVQSPPVTKQSGFLLPFRVFVSFPTGSDGSVVKNLPANARDARNVGLIPGSGRSLGGGNGDPLQYSCLENPWEWTEEPGRL